MTKNRIVQTPEYVLKTVMDTVISAGDISAKLEPFRTEKQIYKWSDPDEASPIPLWAAIQIDAMCLEHTGRAPFAELMSQLADDTSKRHAPIFSMQDATLMMQQAVGKVAGAIIDAISPGSAEGRRFSQSELQAVIVAFEGTRRTLDEMQRAITAYSKG